MDQQRAKIQELMLLTRVAATGLNQEGINKTVDVFAKAVEYLTGVKLTDGDSTSKTEEAMLHEYMAHYKNMDLKITKDKRTGKLSVTGLHQATQPAPQAT